jgi:cysteine-rich repeat protein
VGMEGCDDGNMADGDGCEADCSVTPMSECGNGVVEAGEGCDDGNAVEEDGCPSGAAGQCVAAASCGDGFLWAGMEGCDDGNTEDVDECNNDCATPRWVFITSTNGPNNNGNLGGVSGADAHCQMLADAAALGGTYMAWLTGSDPTTAPAMRFESEGFAGWYMLPTDPPTPVARGWADLTEPNADMPMNYLQAAILADEKGIDVGDANAWTNTNADGTQNGEEHCVDWSSGASDFTGHTGHGKSDILGSGWSASEVFKCNIGARLYCFQVG